MPYLLIVLLFSEIEKNHEKQSAETELYLELLLLQVILQHLRSKKTLNFPANIWLSKNSDDRELLCELPVVEAGKPIYPSMCVYSYLYTGYLFSSVNINQIVVLAILKANSLTDLWRVSSRKLIADHC